MPALGAYIFEWDETTLSDDTAKQWYDIDAHFPKQLLFKPRFPPPLDSKPSQSQTIEAFQGGDWAAASTPILLVSLVNNSQTMRSLCQAR
jgi:hypothetical protein